MAGKSDYLELKMLDHVLGKTTYTAPSTLYVALFTSAPTDAGGGTEVATGSYARAAVTNDTAKFPNASGGAKSNADDVIFATASASWGTVVAVGIYDASTAGNLLFWTNLATPINVPNGGTFSFGATTLVFVED